MDVDVAMRAIMQEPEPEPFTMTEAEYRVALLEHWKERVAGGSEGLPEHDVGLGAKAKAMYRKKRKLAGIAVHPMFDLAPPTFVHLTHGGEPQFGGEAAERGMGDGDDEEESTTSEPVFRPQPLVGAKKARTGKPLARSLMSSSHVPFGTGPLSAERRQVWAATMKQIVQRHRDMFKLLQNQQMDAKKCVQMCQKRYRKDALASLKLQRDYMVRARKVCKDAGTIWRRENAQALAAAGKLDSSAVVSGDVSRSRKEAREAMERKRMEEAERERIRQQKRINFLLTQTELFAHFIGQKMGGITEASPASSSPAPAQSADSAPAESSDKDAKVKKKGQLDKAETREALASAQAALQSRQRSMNTFDEETREASKKLSKKSDQALVNSLDDAALQHKDVNLTAEAASIFNGTLKAYQKIGFNWLVGLYEQGLNGILADEMGLGKTVQTISLLSYLSENKGIWGPFLVVAPTSTMHNWYSELQKFCPQMKVIPYFGANPNERKLLRRMWTNPVDLGTPDAAFHVLVTNYKLIIADEKHFARVKWQYMVLDEAQAVKNSASQRWKTLLGFNCRNRLLLTGTPIQNSMAELWALLHFIMPELFDSFSDFTEWFSKDIESSAEGKGSGMDSAQLKRLQLILQPFMLRRTKKDVLDELVQKVEIEMRTPLSKRQKYYYEVLKKRVTSTAELLDRKMLSKDDKRLHSLMNLVMQFRKVCNHPEIFERRDFVSPLQLRDYVLPSAPPPPTEPLAVCAINYSTVHLSIPILVYEDVAERAWWCRLNAGARTRALTTLLSPWSPDALRGSMFPPPAHPTATAAAAEAAALLDTQDGTRRKGPTFKAAAAAAAAARAADRRAREQGGGLSCLRLSGLSEAEVEFLAWASPAQRWLANLALLSRQLARRSACWPDARAEAAAAEGADGAAAADVEMPGRRRGKVPDIVLPWRTPDMEREWEGQLVVSASRRLHDLTPILHRAHVFSPMAQAPPVQLLCSSRECMRRQEEAMEDAWARKLLLGGFEGGESPLVWHNALSCVLKTPVSLLCHAIPWPHWSSMMDPIYSRLGSNCIQVGGRASERGVGGGAGDRELYERV